MGETTITIAIGLTVLLFVSIISGAIYIHSKMRYDNFQATIKDLTSEQKCIHICGFEFPGSTYLENYKFCMEKCDRISERENVNCIK
ncbi:MAG: hypothetical protein WC755_07015 [Candidatus Woesearchaeota archaeon]|jgi:hypothetical protein